MMDRTKSDPGPEEEQEIGTLVIAVESARKLFSRKLIGKQNPFCTVRYGQQSQRTITAMKGGHAPQWYVISHSITRLNIASAYVREEVE